MLMILLLFWGGWISIPLMLQKVLLAAIVVSGYGLLSWWIHANREALRREDEDRRVQRVRASNRDIPLSAVQARYLDSLERRSVLTALQAQPDRR
jgi:hypothetical protein